jgi:hypothetical protein
MRPVIHRGLRILAIFPIACALMGWSVGWLSQRPPRDDVRLPGFASTALESGSRRPRATLLYADGEHRSPVGPSRDPFDGAAPLRSVALLDPWRGFDSLRLSAVWLQPNNPVAVINGHMVRPGDGVGGFLVAHCARDAVWITGPIASRRLGLQSKLDLKPSNPRS